MVRDGLGVFWRTYIRSYSRVTKDRRVWPLLFQGTAILVVSACYLLLATGLILPREQRLGQLVFNSIIFGLGLVAYLVLRRLNRAANGDLRPLLGGEPAAPSQEGSITPGVLEYLDERMYLVSALVARGICEVVDADGPADASGGVRQRVNQVLRDRELWPKLEAAEAELSGLPAGRWTSEAGDQVIEWMEQLRLLRWLFRFESELAPLTRAALAPEKLLDGLFFDGRERHPLISRAPWEVRVERNSTQANLVQMICELETRASLPASPWPAGFGEWIKCVAEVITSRPDDSWALLAMTDEELSVGAAMGFARYQYADYLIEMLGGAEVISYSTWLECDDEQSED